MSAIVNAVRAGFYLDSVALMRLAVRVAERAGVEDASLVIGTAANKAMLERAGLLAAAGRDADPDDLVIAVRAASEDDARAAVAFARAVLDEPPAGAAATPGWRPRSLEGALRALPGASLALVSVPGPYAAAEAMRALERGLDAMVFSDNVSVEDEVALKARAAALGRLVMGPDCGTAIVAGVPLGFANAVPRGDVGIVAASGTGLQELSVLLARAGSGPSHGLGVGGRDLDAAVGARSTLAAVDLLAADPATARVVVVSKPPDATVAHTVLARLAACGRPALACFLGAGALDAPPGVEVVTTLRAAAAALTGADPDGGFDPRARARAVGPARAGALRGLYAGGTLCAEAQVVLGAAGVEVASNAPVPGARRLAPGAAPAGHALLDLGADEFTIGRPHPMLEPAVRDAPLGAALADPAVAAVLLDVVLGFGAHPDPAGAVARALAAAPAEHPPVVASVCGVEGDPQGFEAQRARLEAAGVVVAPSAAAAAEVAAALLASR